MQIKTHTYKTKNGNIVIFYIGEYSERLSFDECFDINLIRLPRPFIVRNNKVFCSKKIEKNSGKVLEIKCENKVTFRDLKKHIPNIFDIKYIKRINKFDYLEVNKEILETILVEILEKKEIEEIINSLRPKYNE